MKSFFSVLILCFFLSSCKKSDNDSIATEIDSLPISDDITQPIVDDATDQANTGLPNEAYTFEENVVFINMTSTQKAKFQSALEGIKKVVATEEFRDRILNHTYNGQKTFVDNRGYSNAKIYQTILDAAEKLFPTKNNAIDMEVELYYQDNNVIGYTYGTSKRIWVNTKFFNTNSIASVAANLFHEWLHKVGYGHAATWSVSRDYSVPYSIGRMISSMGKNFY